MTTSSAPFPRPHPRRSLLRSAFTLTEVIVSVTLGVLLITMLMGIVVTQARLSSSTGNYADMNEQNRKALTLFDNDMRAAASVRTMTASRVVVDMVSYLAADGLPASTVVEYVHDPKARSLTKLTYDVTGTRVIRRQPLMTGIESGSFTYLNKDDTVIPVAAPRPLEVKKIMLNMKLQRGQPGRTDTDYVVSAVVVMRSRPVG